VNGPRAGAVGVLCLRVAWCVAAARRPGASLHRWVGEAAESQGGGIALRALLLRSAIVDAAGVLAALRGLPLRPWLLASVAGDLADLTATLAADGDALPARARPLGALTAGGAAALTAALAAAGA